MRKISGIFLILGMIFCLWGCTKEEPENVQTCEKPDAVIVQTYEETDAALSEENFEKGQQVTLVRHYEMSDGTWKTDEQAYQYRLEITGRMNCAEKDSTFVFLSNIEEITFEQAWKASGLSSNMEDYFAEEEARFVAWK